DGYDASLVGRHGAAGRNSGGRAGDRHERAVYSARRGGGIWVGGAVAWAVASKVDARSTTTNFRLIFTTCACSRSYDLRRNKNTPPSTTVTATAPPATNKSVLSTGCAAAVGPPAVGTPATCKSLMLANSGNCGASNVFPF